MPGCKLLILMEVRPWVGNMVPNQVQALFETIEFSSSQLLCFQMSAAAGVMPVLVFVASGVFGGYQIDHSWLRDLTLTPFIASVRLQGRHCDGTARPLRPCSCRGAPTPEVAWLQGTVLRQTRLLCCLKCGHALDLKISADGKPGAQDGVMTRIQRTSIDMNVECRLQGQGTHRADSTARPQIGPLLL